MALCHGRANEPRPRRPRMGHRLKTSKGKRAERGRGGGEAAENFGGFSGVCVCVTGSVCYRSTTRAAPVCTSGSHRVCARRVVAGTGGREERTSMLHKK